MIVQLPPADSSDWVPARVGDGPDLAELRAAVLRPSLERLGRFDEVRVRRFFLSAFEPAHTQVLRGSDGVLGCLALRPATDGTWLEHFYLHTAVQGRGLGSGVLRSITAAADATGTDLRLDVLQGSDARRLYERHGFVLDHEDPVDVYLHRSPRSPAGGRAGAAVNPPPGPGPTAARRRRGTGARSR